MAGNSVNRTAIAPFRIEITNNQEADRKNLETMLARFQKTHGTEAAQIRFEFRLKTEGKGTDKRAYLELREQTGFGQFREAIGSRGSARTRERQEALNTLTKTLGQDFTDIVNDIRSESPQGKTSSPVTGMMNIDRDMARAIRNLALEFTADGVPVVDIEPSNPFSAISHDQILAAFNAPTENQPILNPPTEEKKPQPQKRNPLIEPAPDRRGTPDPKMAATSNRSAPKKDMRLIMPAPDKRPDNRQAGKQAAADWPRETLRRGEAKTTAKQTNKAPPPVPPISNPKHSAQVISGIKATTLPSAGFANVTGNSCFMNGSLKVLVASAGPQLDAHLESLATKKEFAPKTPKGEALAAFRALVEGSRKPGTRTDTLITFQRRLGRIVDPLTNTPYFPNVQSMESVTDQRGVKRQRVIEGNYFAVPRQWTDFYDKFETIFELNKMPYNGVTVRTLRGPSDEVRQQGEAAILAAESAGENINDESKSAGSLQDNVSSRINGSYDEQFLVDSGVDGFSLYTGTVADLVRDAGFGKISSFSNDGDGFFKGTWNDRVNVKADWNAIDRITIDIGRHYYKKSSALDYVIYPNGDFDSVVTVPALDTNDQETTVNLIPNEILCHTGTDQNGGHYFSFIRGADGDWYLHNDSEVTRVGQVPSTLYGEFFAPVQISFGVVKA